MKRKVSEILFFIQGGVIFFLIGFLIVMNCMDYALPYVSRRMYVKFCKMYEEYLRRG